MLGADAQFVGITGTRSDPMSGHALDMLKLAGAGWSKVLQYPNGRVSVKTRLLDPNGHQCLARLDQDWRANLDGVLLDLMIDHLKAMRHECEWILVSDYGKGMVTPDLWSALLRQGWKIVVDGKGPMEGYRDARVLQINNVTFNEQCGGNLYSAIAQMQAAGIAHLVVTRGKDGLRLIHEDGLQYDYKASAREELPLSITGAGDQAAASLTSALAAGMGIAEACQFAQLSASLAVRMGGIPTITNLVQRLPISGGPDYDTLRFRDWDGSVERFTAQVRLGGQQLVFCNGIYDLFHAAHEFFLRRAREQAPNPFLLVALNSDKSAKSIKRQPVIAEEHRAQIIKACRHVDAVCIFDEQTPKVLIEAMKPDVYVTPSDHGANSLTAKLVRRLGGDVTVLPRGADCTTDIIKRIRGGKKK